MIALPADYNTQIAEQGGNGRFVFQFPPDGQTLFVAGAGHLVVALHGSQRPANFQHLGNACLVTQFLETSTCLLEPSPSFGVLTLFPSQQLANSGLAPGLG